MAAAAEAARPDETHGVPTPMQLVGSGAWS